MPYYLSKPIAITAYDPQWPARFEEEKARILGVLGDVVVAMEHFGSTAVPGLAAKPLVDLLAGVRRLDDVHPHVAALEHAGYVDCAIQVPGRRLFSRGGPYNEGTHHLHFVVYGSEAWAAPLRFRDYLRTHPDAARRYEQLKRAAAARHGHDIDGYSDEKAAFVQEALAETRAG